VVKKSNVGVVLGVVAGLVLLIAAAGAVAWLRSEPPATPARLATTDPVLPPAKNGAVVVAPAPVVSEVPASATFRLESRVSGYQSSFYLLGFVTNTSPFTIDKPKLTAVLVDKSGKELGTRDGYADSDALPPKATAPVKLLVSDPPAHDHFNVEVVAKKASYIPEAAGNLRLEVLEKPHSTFASTWEVTGKVFNDGKQGARFVKIDVLAFDATDKLVGLDYAYVDGERLAAGASGRFRVMPLYDAAPHHFKFEVSGRPDK
jgi:hypothetical protein